MTATTFFIVADQFVFPAPSVGNFEIKSGPDAGKNGSCFDPNNCTFTFTNDGGPGTDTIEFTPAFRYPSDTATVTFVASGGGGIIISATTSTQAGAEAAG